MSRTAGHWEEKAWPPTEASGVPRRHRDGGRYRAYVPATMSDLALVLPSDLARQAAETERRIHALTTGGSTQGLDGMARFLLRSEAISSSKIEGLAPAPDKVAIAELVTSDGPAHLGSIAEQVARNVRVLRDVGEELADAGSITVGLLDSLQYLLLQNPSISGVRTTQNWIGGSSYSPLSAEFVPPPPAEVPRLMADLVDYANGATHGALVQAALVHAQFETIHPYGDGNGRVGRALIHAVLQRRGLVPSPVLPVSMVLGTRSLYYVSGLSAFRGMTDGADDGILTWLRVFITAADLAVDQAEALAEDIAGLRRDWKKDLVEYRLSQGKRAVIRSDSALFRILHGLPDHPVLTVDVAAATYGISDTSARSALDELREAGVLRERSIAKGKRGYLCDSLLDAVAVAERRLASTRFDTSVAPPTGRAVPEFPNR